MHVRTYSAMKPALKLARLNFNNVYIARLRDVSAYNKLRVCLA